MIRTLVDYDSVTAAGILARLALALDDEGNPASKSVIPDESLVRQRVLSELRTRLGLASDDNSAESIVRVSEALDAESDSLFGNIDVEQTLTKLSQKGRLPSDLFFVRIADNVRDFYGDKYEAERRHIELTVASSDNEQHFGGENAENKGRLFSLFTKHFQDEFPFKSFTLLVMGQRHGKQLLVNHAWRIYSDRVKLSGAENLVEVIKRFADEFGLLIDVDGQIGKFIVTKNTFDKKPVTKEFRVLPVHRPDRRGKMREVEVNSELTFFSLVSEGNVEFAFLAIDLGRYRKSLEAHGW